MRKGGHFRVPLHHVAVGDDVRPADVERTVHLPLHPGTAHQIAQHVPHRDGLDPRGHPARRHHDGQPFREIAQHLEGGRSGSDDHRGPQRGGGDAGIQQNPADLGPRPQVRGQLLVGYVGRSEAAEVDDPAHPRRVRLLPEDRGGPAVRLLEAAAGCQGVHQVVGHVDVTHGRRERLRVGDVAAHDVHLARPWVVPQLLRAAGQAAHPVPRRQKFRYQPPSDVPGGAGDQAVRRLVPAVARHEISASVRPAVPAGPPACPAAPTSLARARPRRMRRCGGAGVVRPVGGTCRP